MAIQGIQPQLQQVNNPFAYGYKPQTEGYHQARYEQGVPNTTPVVLGGYSASDLELANAIAEGNYNSGNINPFVTKAVSTPMNVKGAAFEGFKVPENNGTGELIADVSNREDSIENCPWQAYYA